jgi:hypothetical protein
MLIGIGGYGSDPATPALPPPSGGQAFLAKLKAFYGTTTGKVVLGVVALAAVGAVVYAVTKKKRKATPNKRRKKARKNKSTRRARRNMERPQFGPGTQSSAKGRLGYSEGWKHAQEVSRGGIGDPSLSMRGWRSGSGKQDPYGHAFTKAIADYQWMSSQARKSRSEASPKWTEAVGEFYPGTYVRSPEAGEAPASGRYRESLVKPTPAPRDTARFPSHPRRQWPIPEKIKRYSKSSPYRHRATPNKGPRLPHGVLAAYNRAAGKFNRMEPLNDADRAAIALVTQAQGWGKHRTPRRSKKNARANCGCG